MKTTSHLVKVSLINTNAHGLARLVNEKQLYIRVLWLLAWLTCCALFLRQFIGFSVKLKDNAVVTNFQAHALSFEFPDLYFCFDSPISGSRHLSLTDSAAEFLNQTFDSVTERVDELCTKLAISECNQLYDSELSMMKLNSLSHAFLADNLGHVFKQAVVSATITHSSGIFHQHQGLRITEFHHPSSLRCFRVSLNSTERELLAGPNKSLYLQLMLDAADSRMGAAPLPALDTPIGKIEAPYWALDKETLYWPDRWSALTMYITKPGHFPSRFDTSMTLEAGRSYSVQLGMSERVHREDPDRCIEQHPDVKIANPYDGSAYTFKYDFAYCYNRAVQEHFLNVFNATCAFLPQPWPRLSNRTIYNFTSGWGSLQDIKNFLAGQSHLKLDEPLLRCETARLCTERSYDVATSSVSWPSANSLKSFLRDLDFPNDSELKSLPGLAYLKNLMNDSNTSQIAAEFVRSNFLQLQLTLGSQSADRTTFVRAYSLESFVADVGGILGIYLGMSVLTVCELAQFLHDLIRQRLTAPENGRVNRGNMSREDSSEGVLDRGKEIPL